MRKRIWGKHGAIFPRTRKAIRLILTGIIAVASVVTPLFVWAFM